ncbi:precorrin-3B synthase [Devosia salina]|uniref:Precorrin-3B synthase n=1 Tax=Devosia salina TaxID=2860336 RepID=A0ABX8WG38_9HYPH|nr:precorrin-3B synthase [Devosia salina]QYO77828.1 precorrin-3B synthase [Devosia salina]
MNTATAILGHQSGARRGACPTLAEPMQTGDGLLSRVRVENGLLAPQQLAELASLAQAHGNGIVEVTARGNLQVRGLRPETAGRFARDVAAVIKVETGLVVDTSPIAGLDPFELADARPLARRIRQEAAELSGQLGPKVSVVIDGGGQMSLAALKVDIRLLATGPGQWAVSLGGGKPQIMDGAGAVAAAMAVLGALSALGPEARAIDLFPASGAPAPDRLLHRDGMAASRFTLRTGHTLRVALPFGSARAADLIGLAHAAENAGVRIIRLAPDHTLLLDDAPEALIQHAATLGFITDPADPRRRVSACIGSRGCASGFIAAREMADRLATHVQPGQHLHVSGCSKGCAHPRRAEVTLVGRADGIGLVIDGRAGDTPLEILDEGAPIAALVPSRDRR